MLERYLAKVTIQGVIIALIVAALVAQTVRIEGFKIWPLSYKGYKAENAELRRSIDELSRKSREKQVEVREVIKQGKDRIVVVERDAKKVEEAPLPGNCVTPKEVVQADV